MRGQMMKWSEVQPGMLLRAQTPPTFEVCLDVDGVVVGCVLGHAGSVRTPGSFQHGKPWSWSAAGASDEVEEDLELVAEIKGDESAEELRQVAAAYEAAREVA